MTCPARTCRPSSRRKHAPQQRHRPGGTGRRPGRLCARHRPEAGAPAAPAPVTTTSTSVPPLIGGMTTCTKAALAEPAAAAARALGPKQRLHGRRSALRRRLGGDQRPAGEPGGPTMGAPTSFVFEQEGQFWVVQDKAKVCGTNPTTTTTPRGRRHSGRALPAQVRRGLIAAGNRRRKFRPRHVGAPPQSTARRPYRSGCAELLDITLSLWLRLRVSQGPAPPEPTRRKTRQMTLRITTSP